MKYLTFLGLSSIFLLLVNNHFDYSKNPVSSASTSSCIDNNNKTTEIEFQQQPGFGRMSSVVFKNQEYCRAELDDFVFDAQFSIVSANVYFSGVNFRNVEKVAITSNKLKPLKSHMDRCIPGTLVVFDDVKVIGPDKKKRTIQGLSLQLY